MGVVLLHFNSNAQCATTANVKDSSYRAFKSPSGKIWPISGIFKDTIKNVAGCDSIITFDLKIIHGKAKNPIVDVILFVPKDKINKAEDEKLLASMLSTTKWIQAWYQKRSDINKTFKIGKAQIVYGTRNEKDYLDKPYWANQNYPTNNYLKFYGVINDMISLGFNIGIPEETGVLYNLAFKGGKSAAYGGWVYKKNELGIHFNSKYKNYDFIGYNVPYIEVEQLKILSNSSFWDTIDILNPVKPGFPMYKDHWHKLGTVAHEIGHGFLLDHTTSNHKDQDESVMISPTSFPFVSVANSVTNPEMTILNNSNFFWYSLNNIPSPISLLCEETHYLNDGNNAITVGCDYPDSNSYWLKKTLGGNIVNDNGRAYPGMTKTIHTSKSRFRSFGYSRSSICSKNTFYTDIQTSCGPFTWIDGVTYTTDIKSRHTMPNAAGCDSIITLDLTMLSSTQSTISESACDSYTSPSGKVWTVTGTYLDTIANTVGCDSVITVNLTILSSTQSTSDVNSCGAFTSPSGKLWTMSGTYKDTIPNSLGCDSIITINLRVLYSSYIFIDEIRCDSYTSSWSGKTWTTSGRYIDTIPSVGGCDSLIITIHLTIIQSTQSTSNVNSCSAFTSPSGKIWTASGTYNDTIPNAAGCDSVMIFNLTIISVDNQVNKVKDTLFAGIGDTYQWLDCEDNYSKIDGETNQTFVPASDGEYAVEVTKSGCVDTSGCIFVVLSSIDEINDNRVKIYPNPTTDYVQLEVQEGVLVESIKVYDMSGKEYEITYTNSQDEYEINLGGLPSGNYMIVIQSQGNQIRRQVQKM